MRIPYALQPLLEALTAAAFLLLYSQPALCQSAAAKEPRLQIFVQGGVAAYTDTTGTKPDAAGSPFTLRKSLGPSPYTSAGFRIAISSRNSLEATYSYSLSSGTLTHFLSRPTLPVFFTDTTRFYFDSIHVSYVRTLSWKEKCQTYFLGGMGVSVFTGRWTREIFPSGTFGAGIDVQLNRHFSIRMEQRLIVTGAPKRTFFIDSPTFEVPGKTFISAPSLGLIWRFR